MMNARMQFTNGHAKAPLDVTGKVKWARRSQKPWANFFRESPAEVYGSSDPAAGAP
jgi:hypothetical protein